MTTLGSIASEGSHSKHVMIPSLLFLHSKNTIRNRFGVLFGFVIYLIAWEMYAIYKEIVSFVWINFKRLINVSENRE